ncbi:MAG: phosphate ABC transporter ATP-binding protein [Planctomycetota bacterium]|nr:MAG: phosphate ABC transporter ATP-binding protein [Planctomycetota bacterium]
MAIETVRSHASAPEKGVPVPAARQAVRAPRREPERRSQRRPELRAPTEPRGTVDGLFESIEAGLPFPTAVHESLGAIESVLEIHDFSLWYGAVRALHDVSLVCPRGQVTALIGPSGCGKSTLLRSVNRMNDLVAGVSTRGEMQLEGRPILGPGVDVIALRKRIGMVFQKPNPFPMSIFENVVFPLRVDGVRDKQFLAEMAEQSLRGAGLWDEVKDRLRSSALAMSGGQQQRLCIARAIAGEPEVLLLDEPCSALDPIATGHIEQLLAELAGQYSVLMVTHNMQQALRTSDFTAFMVLGRLVEFGPTEDVFRRPRLKETEDYVNGRFG